VATGHLSNSFSREIEASTRLPAALLPGAAGRPASSLHSNPVSPTATLGWADLDRMYVEIVD
jgi:hypothetical protein